MFSFFYPYSLTSPVPPTTSPLPQSALLLSMIHLWCFFTRNDLTTPDLASTSSNAHTHQFMSIRQFHLRDYTPQFLTGLLFQYKELYGFLKVYIRAVHLIVQHLKLSSSISASSVRKRHQRVIIFESISTMTMLAIATLVSIFMFKNIYTENNGSKFRKLEDGYCKILLDRTDIFSLTFGLK